MSWRIFLIVIVIFAPTVQATPVDQRLPPRPRPERRNEHWSCVETTRNRRGYSVHLSLFPELKMEAGLRVPGTAEEAKLKCAAVEPDSSGAMDVPQVLWRCQAPRQSSVEITRGGLAAQTHALVRLRLGDLLDAGEHGAGLRRA